MLSSYTNFAGGTTRMQGLTKDCAGHEITSTLSPAAAIRIWCPRQHTRRHPDGSIQVNIETGEPLSPAMRWDQCAHGWFCDYRYKAGARGRWAMNCGERYGFSFVFASEIAAFSMEIGCDVRELELSREMLLKIQIGEAIVPWMPKVEPYIDVWSVARELERLMKMSSWMKARLA